MWRRILTWLVTVIIAVVVLFLIVQDLRQQQAAGSLPAVPLCESLPEQGPDHTISLLISRATDHSGIICVQVYNGTHRPVGYGSRLLRLERRWFGLVWVPYFRLSDVIPRILGTPEFLISFVVLPDGYRDLYLPSPYAPAPPGQYRVRFCYREEPEQKEKQCMYSAPFSIPETGKRKETQTVTAE